jgi:hypothetical protein
MELLNLARKVNATPVASEQPVSAPKATPGAEPKGSISDIKARIEAARQTIEMMKATTAKAVPIKPAAAPKATTAKAAPIKPAAAPKTTTAKAAPIKPAAAPSKPERKPRKKAEKEEVSLSADMVKGVHLHIYSEKSFIAYGETKPIKDQIRALGGRFNPNICPFEEGVKVKCWVFSMKQKDAVEKALGIKCE